MTIPMFYSGEHCRFNTLAHWMLPLPQIWVTLIFWYIVVHLRCNSSLACPLWYCFFAVIAVEGNQMSDPIPYRSSWSYIVWVVVWRQCSWSCAEIVQLLPIWSSRDMVMLFCVCHQHTDAVSFMWIFDRYPSWLWICSASLLLIHPWSTAHVASIYAMGW